MTHPGMLQFHDHYVPRVWGGSNLHRHFGKSLPAGQSIGEDWLIADHPQHESVVAEGPHRGHTLRHLLEENAPAVLGSDVKLTAHGRFPLLLKLLDAADVLSVQVHPDDETAKRLDEPDVGKTEMWYVLDAKPGAQLICGLDAIITPETFAKAIENDTIGEHLSRFNAPVGTSVLVPAGTVHAIGKGIIIAEIQQNSDLTYRIYDWGRLGLDGCPRDLHIEKSTQATHFGALHSGPSIPERHQIPGGVREVLAQCPYFAADRYLLDGIIPMDTQGKTFHILLATQGSVRAECGGETVSIPPGGALLIPGALGAYRLNGSGTCLSYSVRSD